VPQVFDPRNKRWDKEDRKHHRPRSLCD